MFKKAFLFVILAATVFAAPVSVGFDIPIPACWPCGPDDPPPVIDLNNQ